MGLHSRKPKANGEKLEGETASAKRSSDMDRIEPLDMIDDDALKDFDIDFWMRKYYPEIRDAATELPLVMEYINQGISKSSGGLAIATIKFQALEGKTYTAMRQEWSANYADKMTEKALDMAMAQDETLNEEKRRIAVLKVCIKRMVSMQENVRAKLEAMRSVESTRRKLVRDEADPEN